MYNYYPKHYEAAAVNIFAVYKSEAQKLFW